MKKVVKFGLFLLMILFLGGCSKTKVKVENIEVLGNYSHINIKDFDLASVKINLIKADKSVEEIVLTNDMVSQDDLKLLSETGTHTITINYNNIKTSFEITLYKSYLVEFMGYDVVEVEEGETCSYKEVSKESFKFNGWFIDEELTNQFDFNTKIEKNTKLYPKFTEIEMVSVEYKDFRTITIEKYSKAEELKPSKEGYTFAGWFKDEKLTKPYNFNLQVEQDIILYAKWIGDICKVNFIDGSIVEVNYGDKVTEPKDVISTNSIVTGWFIDKELTKKYDFNTIIVKDITLYPKWELKSLKVSFYDNDGQIIKVVDVNYNQKVNELEAEPITGYYFSGWFIESNFKTKFNFSNPITKDTSIYGKWTRETFLVIFVDENDEIISREVVKYGDSLQLRPNVPNKEGYDGQWSTSNFTNIKKSVTIFPIYTLKIYTVTYNTDGGSTIIDSFVKHGDVLTKPTNPIKSGYKVLNWYSDSSKTIAYDFSKPVTSNLNLYVRWERISGGGSTTIYYDVVFVSNGGSEVKTQTIRAGNYASELIPTKDGYRFGGWYTDFEATYRFNFTTSIRKDTILYANWIDTSEYELNAEKNGYILTKGRDSSSVTIEATYNGLPVVEIGCRAFYEYTKIKEVVIPSSVKVINEYAFSSSTIEKVTFSGTIDTVNNYAFSNCNNLTEVINIDYLNYVYENVFNGTEWFDNLPNGDIYFGKSLVGYKGDLPYNYVLDIKEGTLYIINDVPFKQKVQKIVFPLTISSIDNNIFEDSPKLTEIEFKAEMKLINRFSFTNSPWYENLPDGDIYFGSFLYTYKGILNMESEVTIKEGTKAINAYAFDSQDLKKVYFPESLEIIGKRAFSDCTNLINPLFPTNLKIIDDYAFYNCEKIESFTLPDSLEYISYSSFIETGWLNNQPNGLIYIDDVLYGYKGNENSTENEENIFVDGVTRIAVGTKIIADKAFSNEKVCVYIPASVETICGYPFNNYANIIIFEKNENDSPIVAFSSDGYLVKYYGINGANSVLVDDVLYAIVDQKVKVLYAGKNVDELKSQVTINNILYNVFEIGAFAFLENSNTGNFVIPDTINRINTKALYYTKFSSYFVPSGLNTVEENIISDNIIILYINKPNIDSWGEEWENKQNVVIYFNANSQNTVIIDDIIYHVLNNEVIVTKVNSNLSDVIIEEDITINTINYKTKEIGQYSFYFENSSLRNVKLANSITLIKDKAFYNCKSLKYIMLPNNTVTISSTAFENCNNLNLYSYSNVQIETSLVTYFNLTNDNYLEENGICYYVKDNKAIVTNYIGKDTSIIIPDKIEINAIEYPVCSIEQKALFALKKIDRIYIPGSIITIENNINQNLVKDIDFATIFFEDSKENIPFSDLFAGVNTSVYYNINISNSTVIDGITYSIMNDQAIVTNCDSSKEEITILDKVIINEEEYNVVGITSKALHYTKWYENQPSGVVYVGKFLYDIKGNPTIEKLEVTEGTLCIADNQLIVDGLKEIVLPESLLSFGSSCFNNLEELVKINIPSNIKVIETNTFVNCYELKNVELRVGLKEIKKDAFIECSNLKYIILPEGFEKLEANAFNSCDELNTLYFPSSFIYSAENTYQPVETAILLFEHDSINELSGCKKYANIVKVYVENGCVYAIDNLNKVTVVNIPDASEVIIPDTITANDTTYDVSSIDNNSYLFCEELLDLFIGNKVLVYPEIEIEGTIYYKNTYDSISKDLDSRIYFGVGKDNIYIIGDFKYILMNEELLLIAYLGDDDIITIPEMETINEITYEVKKIGYSVFKDVKVEEVILPNTITKIYDCAFMNCEIKKITLSSTLKEIGSKAFYECGLIDTINLPSGLEIIRNSAFYNCNLIYVNVPSSVSTIEDDAFSSSYIKDIYFEIDTKPITYSDNLSLNTTTLSYNTRGLLITLIDENIVYEKFSIKLNDKISSYKIINKTGYKFVGWYTDKELTSLFDISTSLTDNYTLYAKLVELTKINYHLDTDTTLSENIDYYDCTIVTILPIAIKDGFLFVGWYTNVELTGDMITEIGITLDPKEFQLYPKFVATYKINYVDASEFENEEITGYSGLTEVILPTPIKDSCTFIGWYDNPSFSKEVITKIAVTENPIELTFYAKWMNN